MLELFFYFMSTVSLFVLELLYCVTVGQDLADVYKKQQNVKKLINGNSCDLFPDNFWERLLTTLKDLENNNHGYLALAMFYNCLLYTSPSPRDATLSRMPCSA